MVAALLHLDALLDAGRQLPWAVSLAGQGADELVISWPGAIEGGGRERALAADAAEASGVHAALDARLGADAWRPAAADDDEPGAAPSEGSDDADAERDAPPLTVRCVIVDGDAPIEPVLELSRRHDVERIVHVIEAWEGEDSDSSERRRQLLRGASAQVVVLRPGQDAAPHGLLVGAARGPHGAGALRLARELTVAGHGPGTVVYVEPPVGREARDVGRRILGRILGRALGDDTDALEQRVELDDVPHRGLQRSVDELGPGLVLVGSSKSGALGRRLRGTTWQRLVRRAEGPAVAAVRAALPLNDRFMRRIEALLQRLVPQLAREQRLDLVERVQSNSHWDFDFFVLMCAATLIASAGLILDAPAVVIGAMLVAPLMTPMLGIGMALAQGNPYLVRSASRSVLLGASTAVLLGLVMGACHPGFVAASDEMVVRGGPSQLDFFVAFVSGVAAAYASSRPGLLAALPGVAIAAALVPPLATAGLAVSLGEWRLAGGAALLFVVNLVAISLASGFALWSVGMRSAAADDRRTRVLRWGSVTLAAVLAVVLAQPDGRALPAALEQAWSAALPPGSRVARRRWLDDDHLELTLRGPRMPEPDLAATLARLARPHLGAPLRLTLRAEWQAIHDGD